MDGPPDRDKRGRRRFQFGLRSLFAVNFLAAVVLGVTQYAASEPIEDLILSSSALILGASWTLVMAVIGDAAGREWGALVTTVIGAGIWGLLIPLLRSTTPSSLPMHYVAILFTVGGIVILTVIRLRGPKSRDDDPHVTERLLRSQRKRKGRLY